jgi:hypothetical protein
MRTGWWAAAVAVIMVSGALHYIIWPRMGSIVDDYFQILYLSACSYWWPMLASHGLRLSFADGSIPIAASLV